MFTQSIIHQQSHFYPCQLSLFKSQCPSRQKFIFYSPLDTYKTIFDPSKSQCDYIDLQEVQFQTSNNLQLSKDQQCLAMSTLYKLEFFLNENEKIMSIKTAQNQEIMSNVISLLEDFSMHDSIKNENMHRIAYLTLERQMQGNDLYLNISGLDRVSSKMESYGEELNPETEKNFEGQWDRNNELKVHNCQMKKKQTTRVKLPLIERDKSYSFQSFQLKRCNFSEAGCRQLAIFDKLSSTIHLYNREYQTVSSAISCNDKGQFQLLTGYEANSISILSDSIILNSHCNGIVKIIDKRVGRVVHMRNLMQELNQRSSFRLQNSIKFWDTSNTFTVNDSPTPTSSFLVNLQNKVYEVDLRNGLAPQNAVFKFNTFQMIANYEILIHKKERVTAFTTQHHSQFRGYVVSDKQN